MSSMHNLLFSSMFQYWRGDVRTYFEQKHLLVSKLFLVKALPKTEHYKGKYSAENFNSLVLQLQLQLQCPPRRTNCRILLNASRNDKTSQS